jgi:hypothetical protein
MATIASRILSSGTQLTAGYFDEVTYNPNSTAVVNLYDYSQDFSQSRWTRPSSTITTNTTAAPDGTLTASTHTSTGLYASVWQLPTTQPTTGQIVTVSVFVKYGNMTPNPYFTLVQEGTTASAVTWNLLTQTVQGGYNNLGSTLTNAGNGWYRASMTFLYSKVNHGTLQPKIWIGDYTGINYSTSYVYIWGAQIEYGSTLSAYQPKAASTNLIRYSEEFDNAGYWIKNSLASVTPNATIAPDGTLTADKLVSPVAAGPTRKSIYQPTAFNLTAGVVYTFSVYVKAAEFTTATIWFDSVNAVPPDGRTSPGYWGSDCRIDLTNGSNVASVNTPGAVYGIAAGNGWYRLVLTAKMTVTSGINFGIALGSVNGAVNEVGNGVDGIYVWGAQLEIGSFATPYKKTTLGTNITLPRFVKNESANTYAIIGEYDEVTFNPTTPRLVNIFPNSDDWTLNVQLLTNATLTSANTVAPDGTLTGSRLTSTIAGGTNTALIQKLTSSFSKNVLPWCASAYVKQGTSPITTLNLAFVGGTTYKEVQLSLTWATLALAASGSNYNLTGSLGYGIIDAGNGWYRIWACLLNTYAATQLAGRMYVRDSGTSNVLGEYSYIWGLQIEQGYVPTIYQSTGVSGVISTPRFANKIVNTGDNYIKQEYDEWTGVPITDGAILYVDAGLSPSYTQGSTTWTNIANTSASGTIGSVPNGSGGILSAPNSNDIDFDASTMSIKINDNRNSTNGQIRFSNINFNALAVSNNFTVMFAAKKDYYGILPNVNHNGNTELFQGVDNGYDKGWRIQEFNQGTPGAPFTGTHNWSLQMSPAAVPSGWSANVTDSSSNRWCIVAFSVSSTNVYAFCNGNITSTTNLGTYYGGPSPTSRGWINFTGAGAGSFNGRLGFFMVFNRALSTTELTYNYNVFKNRYDL